MTNTQAHGGERLSGIAAIMVAGIAYEAAIHAGDTTTMRCVIAGAVTALAAVIALAMLMGLISTRGANAASGRRLASFAGVMLALTPIAVIAAWAT